jgi:hypothetical protein
MSSNNYDSNINTGNYEEYFLLYVDRELDPQQMKMVESFVDANPHLRAELELLMDSTLTPETFSFDKTSLMADKMQLPSPHEELLLYIDEELPAKQRNIVELEIASNNEYASLHAQLLKARLDPDEVVPYPNKKELYRRTGSIVAFRPWMRVAAAVILMAGASGMYLSRQQDSHTTGFANAFPADTHKKNENVTVVKPSSTEKIVAPTEDKRNAAATTEEKQNEVANVITVKDKRKLNLPLQKMKLLPQQIQEQQIAQSPKQNAANDIANVVSEIPKVPMTTVGEFENTGVVNNSVVTKTPAMTLNNGTATEGPGNEKTQVEPKVASNERKGSVKGFLRKATRLIEKKTGIDPTSDGELLIGMVAVNLK